MKQEIQDSMELLEPKWNRQATRCTRGAHEVHTRNNKATETAQQCLPLVQQSLDRVRGSESIAFAIITAE